MIFIIIIKSWLFEHGRNWNNSSDKLKIKWEKNEFTYTKKGHCFYFIL
jgi:hypothetical protein